MRNKQTVSTSTVAGLGYTPLKTTFQQMSKPEIEPVLPPPASNGQTRRFNERQTVLMLIAMDLVRAGIKFPLAASWSVRIAEELCCDPDADQIHVEFRRNGALFFFTTDEAPEAAEAAGPARWRLTFELTAYRAAFRGAVRVEAGEDVDA